ncbi:unnamed protein product [Angiostrongylus costaricensis]|uniref:Phasin_2 domain-containing protein n=1 Tax=Angiostrongylus costaricensis TaxID=334426 RepID=A0A0R3Q2A8_ANGCS|nr:unnamed protein product [Angiostrongylus costaricensis]
MVFDSIDIKAVRKALDSQGVFSEYMKIFGEVHKNFTTKVSQFYNDINIDVKRGARKALDSQGVFSEYMKIFGEVHKNFTTKVSQFYNDINIDVKRGAR